MITVSFRFAHSFKIMRLPKPIIHFRAHLQPVQVLCSGIGGKIDVLYIHCLDGRVSEAFEVWDLVEDVVC